MCIRFVTIRRIPKKECVCQKLQRSLRYLWVNSVQVAHEGASFADIRGTLEWKGGGGFDIHSTFTDSVRRIPKTMFKSVFSLMTQT